MGRTTAKLAKLALVAGLAALGWLFDAGGVRGGAQDAAQGPLPEGRVAAQETVAVQEAVAMVAPSGDSASRGKTAAAPAAGISLDGEYDSRDEVAAYIRVSGGRLPKNYITKAQARQLGWQGGPLEPYAPGKSIGGDHFGNYEHRLPESKYRECDIATRGKPRGGKRLIFTTDGRTIYYTEDHYETFRKLEEK